MQQCPDLVFLFLPRFVGVLRASKAHRLRPGIVSGIPVLPGINTGYPTKSIDWSNSRFRDFSLVNTQHAHTLRRTKHMGRRSHLTLDTLLLTSVRTETAPLGILISRRQGSPRSNIGPTPTIIEGWSQPANNFVELSGNLANLS